MSIVNDQQPVTRRRSPRTEETIAMTACHDPSSWEPPSTFPPLRFRHIVVGVDGSRNSLAALRTAAQLGHRDGATLELVCAYRIHLGTPYSLDALTLAPPTGLAGEGNFRGYLPPPLHSQESVTAREILDDAVLAVFGPDSNDNLILRTVDGKPHDALLRIASGADLLVVGARGHSGALGMLLGSTAQSCARYSPCPVLVVPTPQEVSARRSAPARATEPVD
jgi:nucleotide-binding universal stress UspA family protein